MQLATATSVLGFVIGCLLGSFINVVIHRMPQSLSVVLPRSFCPHCKHTIAFYDNIPLVSFLLLGQKCRHCKAPIAWRYFVVELVIGLLSLILVQRYGLSEQWLKWVFFSCILIAVSYIDMTFLAIPTALLLFLLGGALAFGAIEHHFTQTLIGMSAGFLFLGAILIVFTALFRKTGRLTSEQYAMGFADPLLLAGIGGFVGFEALPLVLFLGCLQGLVFGLLQWWLKRFGKRLVDTDDKDVPDLAIAFGPFLSLGAIEVMLFSHNLLS